MAYENRVTYRLLVGIPLDVEWRGQRWRFEFCPPGSYCDGRCQIVRTDDRPSEFIFCDRQTAERCWHDMTQIGIEMLPLTQAAHLCAQLVKEGRAERLAAPRSWTEFPFRETHAA